MLRQTALAFAAATLLASAAPALAQDAELVLRDVTVLSYSEKPAAGSKASAAYVGVTVSPPGSKPEELLLAYEGPDQRFPKIGDHCNIAYTVPDTLDGVIGRGRAPTKGVKLVSDFNCWTPG